MEEISKKWFCVPKGVGGQAYGTGSIFSDSVSERENVMKRSLFTRDKD